MEEWWTPSVIMVEEERSFGAGKVGDFKRDFQLGRLSVHFPTLLFHLWTELDWSQLHPPTGCRFKAQLQTIISYLMKKQSAGALSLMKCPAQFSRSQPHRAAVGAGSPHKQRPWRWSNLWEELQAAWSGNSSPSANGENGGFLKNDV